MSNTTPTPRKRTTTPRIKKVETLLFETTESNIPLTPPPLPASPSEPIVAGQYPPLPPKPTQVTEADSTGYRVLFIVLGVIVAILIFWIGASFGFAAGAYSNSHHHTNYGHYNNGYGYNQGTNTGYYDNGNNCGGPIPINPYNGGQVNTSCVPIPVPVPLNGSNQNGYTTNGTTSIPPVFGSPHTDNNR